MFLNQLNPNIWPVVYTVCTVYQTWSDVNYVVPFVSIRELKHGIPVTDENDNRLGESSKAAQQAITQVVVSRILMASPGMGSFALNLWIWLL